MGFQEAGLAEAGREKAGLAEKISGSRKKKKKKKKKGRERVKGENFLFNLNF